MQKRLIGAQERDDNADSDSPGVTSPQVRYFTGLLRDFTDDLKGQVEVVLLSVAMAKEGRFDPKVSREAKKAVDRLLQSSGKLLEMFRGGEDRKIDLTSLTVQVKLFSITTLIPIPIS